MEQFFTFYFLWDYNSSYETLMFNNLSFYLGYESHIYWCTMPAWQKKLTGYQTLDPCWSEKEHEYYSISTVELPHFIQKYTKLTNTSDTESFHRPGQQNYVHRMNKGRVPSWKPLGDQRSDRGEELVQIERQRVELCAPRVFLVAPKLVPPVVAPVLPRVFHL